MKTNSVTIPGYPDLMAVACNVYRTTREHLCVRNKSRELSETRQIIMYVAIEVYNMSRAQAGLLVDRDGVTALYSKKHVADLIETDPAFAAKANLLINKFRSLCSTN